MRRHQGICALVLATLAATGCAVGNTHTFRYLPAQTEIVGSDQPVLLFKVQEARPAVVEEGEPASWVGEQRSGFGIPYNVLTTDGRPFTKVVEDTIERDLRTAGFEVKSSQEEAADNAAGVAASLRQAAAERGLFIVVKEFNSNTYTNIDVEWDLVATVYDGDGVSLAESHLEGRTTLSGSVLNPPGAAKRSVPPFFYDLMRELVLENEDIMAALTSETPLAFPR